VRGGLRRGNNGISSSISWNLRSCCLGPPPANAFTMPLTQLASWLTNLTLALALGHVQGLLTSSVLIKVCWDEDICGCPTSILVYQLS
jgi:hypothetical protein